MAVFYAINAFVHFEFLGQAASAVGVAVIHSAFNVAAVIIIYPFTSLLERLVYLTIPETEEEKKEGEEGRKEIHLLDARFLSTPGFALEQCRNVAIDMANHARDALFLAMELIDKFDQKESEKVIELEELVDYYEDELGSYLVKLSSKHLSEKDSQELSVLLHCIGDFERISDHAINIMESAREMYEKKLAFSKKAQEELVIFTGAIKDIVSTSVRIFQEEDLKLAGMVDANACAAA